MMSKDEFNVVIERIMVVHSSRRICRPTIAWQQGHHKLNYMQQPLSFSSIIRFSADWYVTRPAAAVARYWPDVVEKKKPSVGNGR